MQNLTCLALLPTGSPPTAAEADSALYLLWIANLLIVGLATFFLARRSLRKSGAGDLADAARIDGCGGWDVYWHVKLPLLRPALGLIGILILAAAVDDILAPLVDADGKRFLILTFPAIHGPAYNFAMIGTAPELFGLLMASLMLFLAVLMTMFAGPAGQSQKG